MRHTILMPKLGLTMTEGIVSEWLVDIGAPINKDDGLFIVETDKVATEVAAQGDGVLDEVLVAAGQSAAVGDIVGYWRQGSASAGDTTADTRPAGTARVETPPADSNLKDNAAPAVAIPAHATRQPAGRRVRSTPLARRFASAAGIDITSISGSGAQGVIKARDVRKAQASALAAEAALPDKGQAAQAQAAIDTGTRSKPDRGTAAMARRLSRAKQDVPHFYLSIEVDVSRLLALRQELNDSKLPARLTLNHFIIAAIGRTLLDHPEANRVWADGDILSYTSTDVGVAVNTDKGLIVPIVRDAGRLSLLETARRSQALVEAARNGTLRPDDTAGGAITVSNAGMFNVRFMTPIINPGQAMILGVGSVNDVFRPDAQDQPALRKEIGLVLAGDHRLIDGVSGLTFLNGIGNHLQQPLQLLVGA